jgi:hypothetical protein
MEVGQGPNWGCSSKGEKKYPYKTKTFRNQSLQALTAGYTYSMKVHLGKDEKVVNQDVTDTHVAVRDLCKRLRGLTMNCTRIILFHPQTYLMI